MEGMRWDTPHWAPKPELREVQARCPSGQAIHLSVRDGSLVCSPPGHPASPGSLALHVICSPHRPLGGRCCWKHAGSAAGWAERRAARAARLLAGCSGARLPAGCLPEAQPPMQAASSTNSGLRVRGAGCRVWGAGACNLTCWAPPR